MADVYLHIGLAKTGTTTVQVALRGARADLTDHGVLVPGSEQRNRRAAYDLIGRRLPGASGATAGSWNTLVEEIDAWSGPAVVLSEEILSLARPRQVARLASSLAGHRLFVLLGLRDISRTIPSSWQQEVRKGHPTTWGQYVAAVTEPAASRGPASAGLAFWMRHDPVRVLRIWERHVPPDRLRILTVPPCRGAPNVLLGRFAEAANLPQGVLRARGDSNPSLGTVQTEVLRRLNAHLGLTPSHQDHLDLVRHGLLAGLKAGPRRELAMSASELEWARRYTDTVRTLIRSRSYPVVGDLGDLGPLGRLPDAAAGGSDPLAADLLDVDPDQLAAEDLLAGTEQVLYALARDYVALRKEVVPRAEAPAPTGLGNRLGGQVRAAGFGAKVRVMRHADHNPALARLLWMRMRREGMGEPGPPGRAG